MRDNVDFWAVVKRIRSADDRIRPEAYAFVMESLDFTINNLGERRHVDARELLDGLCGYARERYGMLGHDVLSRWGVATPDAFGRIVFQLVDAGVLSKRSEDRPDDFRVEFDLKSAIEDDYFEQD